MGATTAVLAVRASGNDVALKASRVLRVIAPADWSGELPVDLDVLLHGTGAERPHRHVLVLLSAQGMCAIATAGDLAMQVLPTDEIYPLPTLLWPAGYSPIVFGVVEPPDSPPLLVLDTVALTKRAATYNLQGEAG
jgi:hypothetical protein